MAKIINRKLIHCLTNPISINDMANAILALGSNPIMAEHPLEVLDITGNCDALLVNLGNLTDVRIESMYKSLELATKREIPVVLDLVGVGAISFRRNLAIEFVEKFKITVIKGNYSEIESMYLNKNLVAGVDACENSSFGDIENMSLKLAKNLDTVVVATGEVDIIAFENKLFRVSNGHWMMGRVTGSGCVLGGIIATMLANIGDEIYAKSGDEIYAKSGDEFYKKTRNQFYEKSGDEAYNKSVYEICADACALWGICGELADKSKGLGTFRVEMINMLSTLELSKCEDMIKICEN